VFEPAPSAITGTEASPREYEIAAPQSDRQRLGQGTWLVQVGGAGSNDQDFDIGGGQLAGTVGFMVADQVEVSVRQTVGFVLRNNADDTWNGATRGALDLYLVDGPIAPYVGASGGWIYGDTVREDVVLGPEAGIKFFIKDDAFIDLRGQYLFLLDAKDDFSDAFETGSWFYDLAMGVTF